MAWNVHGSNDFVIRGGTGLYFAYLQTQYTYSPQLYSRMITASFINDGKPGFITDPTRGISTYDQALAAAPPQAARIITPNFKNPYTWQSSIGFQKQLNAVTGIEADLVHYNLYRDTARSQVWGATPGVNTGSTSLTGISNNSSRSTRINIYGRIIALQNATVGIYADALSITVSP